MTTTIILLAILGISSFCFIKGMLHYYVTMQWTRALATWSANREANNEISFKVPQLAGIFAVLGFVGMVVSIACLCVL